jgi:hypothetical protein
MNEHAILTLLGIASVATAISGFSGVVAVFGSRADGKWLPIERFRTTNMLILSLVTCLLSFVPLTEELFEISAPVLWISSSLLLGIFCIFFFAYSFNLTRKKSLRSKGVLIQWVRIVFFVCLGIAIVLQAVNVTGVFIERGPGPFVAGLLFALIPAGLQFAFLVLMPLTSTDL